MTQAFNLSQLANKVNSSGLLDASTGLTNAVPVANGGTGLSSTPANGALDIGNGTGFTRTTLTAGSNISITNGAGSISIAQSGGVSSIVAGNGITVSGSGAITVSQDIYTGTTVANLSYPVGSYLGCVNFGSNVQKNQTATVTNNAADTTQFYCNGGSGSTVSGTWRSRGQIGASCVYPLQLMQRVA